MRKIPAMPITSHAESKPEVSTSLPISRLPTPDYDHMLVLGVTPEKAPDAMDIIEFILPQCVEGMRRVT